MSMNGSAIRRIAAIRAIRATASSRDRTATAAKVRSSASSPRCTGIATVRHRIAVRGGQFLDIAAAVPQMELIAVAKWVARPVPAEAPQGGEVYYDEQPGRTAPRPTPSTTRSTQSPPKPTPAATEETSIMEENRDAPRAKPQPGRPVHSAPQPLNQVSGRYPPGHRPQQLTPAQLAARRAAQMRAEEAGVRSASYQR